MLNMPALLLIKSMAGCRDAWMGSAQGLAVTADFALFVKQCLVLWQLAVFYELYIIAVRLSTQF